MLQIYGKTFKISILSITIALWLLVYPEAEVKAQTSTQTLVILVDFNDVSSTYTADSFQSLFLSSGTKSVADYYNEVSYGQFSIMPATENEGTSSDGVVGWLRLNQNHPDCERTSDPDACSFALASNAIQASDPYVDFSLFDGNGDGTLTPDELSIIIVVAGYEYAYQSPSGPSILGHKGQLPSPLTLDGKLVRNYAMFGEKHLNHQATIGIMAHELAHLRFGLPDLNDGDYTSHGLGSWSLMSFGQWNGTTNNEGDSPAHPDAWSKVKLGWAPPSMSSCPLIQIPQVETNPVIYKFVTKRPKEYFLVENRQKVGFDKYLPGEGLAIYHVDESITTQNDMEWYPGCTTCTSHYMVAIEQADGRWDLEKNYNAGDKGDLYPYRRNKAFTSASTPNSNDYAGNKTDVSITRTSASKATMSARIDVQKTSGIPIAVAPFHQMFPQVASDGTNSLVVWSDSDYTDRTTKIYGVLVGQPGGLVGECRFFIAEGSWPSVAFDGKNYLVVYTNIDGDIYGTRVTPSGRVLDRRGFPISTTVGDWEFAPRIAFNGTIYLVVWNRYLSIPATFNVFGARVRPDGVVLDPQGIDVFPSIDGEFYPDVASDGANFLVVAGDSTFTSPWIYHVYGARISPDGILQDPNGIVIATTGINDQSVAFDGVNYLVVWTDIRNSPELGESNWDIYGSRVTPDGTVIDPGGIAISTAPRNQDTPSIMFGPYMYLVAWRDARISPWDSHLYGARISAFAIVMDPDGVPISTAVNEQGFPDITFDGSNFLVVWEDARNQSDGGNYDDYGARVSLDGTVLDP